MDTELKDLIEETWAEYRTFESLDVVKKIPPILFVGDLDGYKQSKIKVITVALNPSKKGAEPDVHAREFHERVGIDNATLSKKPEKYIKGLLEYFEKRPNMTYFNSFEPILNELETSYGSVKLSHKSYQNRALHTDLCSQLTTDPNWGGLIDPTVQNDLAQASSSLWNKLVAQLKPNLILASFGESHLKWIKLPPYDLNRRVVDINTWDTTFKIGEKQYPVNCLWLNVGLQQPQKVFFALGQGSRRPFMINNEYKKEIGRQLFNLYEE